jgi:hypothetical protein
MTAPRPAKPVDLEYPEGDPPKSELGSSFPYDGPVFAAADNGNVYAAEEPLVRDYQHMLDTDGTAASIELMLTYPIIAAQWEIDPAKNDAGEAEFIYDALTDLPHQGGPLTTVEQLVSQMTSAFTTKRAYFEKVFKVNDDDKVVYHKLAFRPPETCELALDARRAEPRGFRQMPVIFDEVTRSNRPLWGAERKDWVEVGPERSFVYIHGTWRDPLLGESAMRVPYHLFQTKRKILWLWYQFLDVTALAKAIVQNQDEQKARVDALKVSRLRGAGVVALGDDTTVTPYNTSGSGAAEFREALAYLDTKMLDSGLLGFMGLSSAAGEGKGSYALAESLSKMYLKTRRMVAMDMARQITNEVIGPLIAYNFGPRASIPRFKFGPLSEANEVNVLDTFSKVATTGAKVPVEFYDQLIARVSTLLELDPGKVAKDLEVSGSPQEMDLQQLQNTVDGASAMVQNAQAGVTPTGGGNPANSRSYGANSVTNPRRTSNK